MAKKYFIRYGNFANMYDLAWAKDDAEMSALESIGFERCSRKWTEKNKEEIDRQHYDAAFSGYANRAINPAKYFTEIPASDRDTWLWRNYNLKGVIWE